MAAATAWVWIALRTCLLLYSSTRGSCCYYILRLEVPVSSLRFRSCGLPSTSIFLGGRRDALDPSYPGVLEDVTVISDWENFTFLMKMRPMRHVMAA